MANLAVSDGISFVACLTMQRYNIYIAVHEYFGRKFSARACSLSCAPLVLRRFAEVLQRIFRSARETRNAVNDVRKVVNLFSKTTVNHIRK